jgi:hypothetical protein
MAQSDGITSDTASNMTHMMDFLPDLSWTGCVNHIIQLVIKARIYIV